MKNTVSIVFALAVLANSAWGAIPMSKAHEEYLKRGIMAIVHWGPNTYTGQEWGFGNADPAIVQPAKLDPAQWVKAMKDGGIKSVVLVAKHHDGFCLWPSELNQDYSTAAIPGKFKKANVVRALSRACKKEGLAFGVYLSPWDRHQASYASDAYVEYFHAQWEDLLTNYGDICEIWLDGANGGDGWYGGVNGGKGEKRSLKGGEKYYQKPRLLANLISKHPMAVAFGGHGVNSVAWCGNERGQSPEDWNYDRKGEDGKMYFMPPEADTPLRGGWFFHGNQHPKSLKQMTESYFNSVGHGAVLNWGIAPDKEGRICDDDVKRLKEFGDYVRAFEACDFAKGANVATGGKDKTTYVDLRLAGPAKFNAVDFGEDLSMGQLVTSWKVEAMVEGKWKVLAEGRTATYRRIARFEETKSDRVRITATGTERPKIVNVAVRYAPAVQDDGTVDYGETDTAKWMTGKEKEKR